MKKKTLLDTIPRRIVDETASTFDEIRNDKNIPYQAMYEMLRLNMANGAWEQVYKHGNYGKLVKAYRLKE
jgi:hypothetical protein